MERPSLSSSSTLSSTSSSVLLSKVGQSFEITIDDLSHAFEHRQFRENYAKTIIKPNWYNVSQCNSRQKKLIVNLQKADEQFQLIVIGDCGNLENVSTLDQFNVLRQRIKEIFVELLRHEMKFSRQNNVEQHFWKILYYNLIECTRRLATDKANNKNVNVHQKLCLNLIADGIQLFENILLLLGQTYEFRLDQFIGAESGKNLKGLKYISLALVSAQKCCMCLGDLHRYRAMLTDSPKYDEAGNWYIKAYQIIPSNGMPSNQLAILALYNKKKFNAIFYHMRSLNASNPIKSAKESLVILFDELRKKYQLLNIQKPSKEVDADGVGSVTAAAQGGDGCGIGAKAAAKRDVKREIWVHPTDGQLNYRTVFLDSQENESLDSADLYKKFIFNFSHLHGILFTRVGIDSLEICMEQTLKQFQELLNHSNETSCVFTLQKMVQMIILNIYSIENTIQLSMPSKYALAFSFTFIGIILNKLQCEMTDMLATNVGDTIATVVVEPKCRINGDKHYIVQQINKFKLSDSINNSLAAISLWCNWLKFNWSVWTTDDVLAAIYKFNKSYDICIWDDFAQLAQALDKFNFEIEEKLVVRTEPLDDTNSQQHCKRIRLTEDMITLAMSSIIRNDYVYCDRDVDERNACTILRWQNVHAFCTVDLMREDCLFLCRLDFGEIVAAQLCNENDADTTTTISTNTPHLSGAETTAQHESSSNETQIDAHANTTTDQSNPIDSENGGPNASSNSSNEIQKLLQRKIELEQTHKMQEKLNKFTQNILRQTNAETICLEIRPKYLIPDTNCFIDFLHEIKQLVNVYPLYHVILPIVVLNELEGLAKGDETGTKMYDTPTKTSLNAHKALVFLKSAGSNVKCATTKGSYLNSMAFTKESDTVNAIDGPVELLNNDDKILMTAVNLTKRHSNDAMINSKPISLSNLQRKVILLTNDRNLKLKAITQNIPVRELVDFVKWSGVAK